MIGVFVCYNMGDMESVIFEGKEYIKISVLAERFRYTSDYLGQLCRGKKVDARLIGRAWYINLESLKSHRSSKYKQKAVTEISSNKASNNYLSRIDVEPILKKKTISILGSRNGHVSRIPVKYEGDDYALIPKMQKEAVFKSLPISLAEGKDVRIHGNKEISTQFNSEPLPEFALAGAVKVIQIPEVLVALKTSEVNQIKFENTSQDDDEEHPIVQEKRKIVIRRAKQAQASVQQVRRVARETKTLGTIQQAPLVAPVREMAKTSFRPVSVSTQDFQKKAVPTDEKDSYVIPILTISLALIGSITSLILGTHTYTDSLTKTNEIYIELRNFESVVSFLKQ